jgi:hypothetical protein
MYSVTMNSFQDSSEIISPGRGNSQISFLSPFSGAPGWSAGVPLQESINMYVRGTSDIMFHMSGDTIERDAIFSDFVI